MKYCFLIALLLASSAWACPNLKGTFICRDGIKTSVLKIDSSGGEHDLKYVMNDSSGVAVKSTDGEVQHRNSLHGLKNVTWSGHCEDKAFIEETTGVSARDEAPVHVKKAWFMTNGKLIQRAQYSDDSAGLKTAASAPSLVQAVCDRKKL
jgi:hypothetical protein